MPNSSTIQKTSVPKQLLGVPSDFTHGRSFTSGTTLYSYEYKNKAITIDMDNYGDVSLIFYKYNDNDPIYLDIDIDVEYNNTLGKSLYLRYSDETEKSLVYMHMDSRGVSLRFPMYKGWYIQKRAYRSGNSVPVLLKL